MLNCNQIIGKTVQLYGSVVATTRQPNGQQHFRVQNGDKKDVLTFTHSDGSRKVVSYDDGNYTVASFAKPGYCGAFMKNVSEEEAMIEVMKELSEYDVIKFIDKDGSSDTLKRNGDGFIHMHSAKPGYIGAFMHSINKEDAMKLVEEELKSIEIFV